ncbi:TetR/AcrR family transcriptional regulator [Clostridium butyricum]|jgi:AcrR family transcriptional regulator|uniref:TetR family transcriptional regulator n=2 Tax=Clostridium butyricum TaxID=1492 RepID=A0A6L9EIA6_CLOBU|nr:TetR/AcrR family transcriptional regulator [Clostridium butyricum]MBS5983562.1 TetR/AcrR family transcriptional regulator [Clostridium butyricum]MBZ0313125.1 TetR/AcrR family transcriptional regulator [Clostridium butyricum]MDB2151703.1 TetR/AcrR family transcriptional regulator [Clostridium butyricum]MDU4752701.1 TetR/AcrR family transcriptional regulator [Clostridium butyricum]NAS16297.1 TetR family transcriptional regulator [Clostridium butyricum]
MNTKEKILSVALTLFSTKGYKAVSVRHIASDVGIKASSLYNHFENKQEILDELIKKNTKYIEDFLKDAMDLDSLIVSRKHNRKKQCDIDFIDTTLKIVKFFIENDNVIKFRKLLTIEQFNNPTLSALYKKIFISDILEYESKLFSYLMDKNLLIRNDPYILALQFFSPIFLLLYNDDKVTLEDYSTVEKHIFQFKDIYSMKG